MENRTLACVVPARLGSSRFPGKLIQELEGRPVILHTLQRAVSAGCFTKVICLAEDELIVNMAQAAGFEAQLSPPAANGTDRIACNLTNINADLVVNLQGDEPVFPLEPLRNLAAALQSKPDWVHTLVHENQPTLDDMGNPHRVKAYLDENGFIQDFIRPPQQEGHFRLHMGVYGYSLAYLRRYAETSPSSREMEEGIELLRNLKLAPIKGHHSLMHGQAVDVPEDLEKAKALLLSKEILLGKS